MDAPLRFEYDSRADVLTVEGITYSGELFRCFGLHPTGSDELLKILKREDGCITVQSVTDRELAHRFALVAKAGS